jgi:hypothetical protein
MATNAPAVEHIEYRVAVIRPASETVLVVDHGDTNTRLPRVRIPKYTRVTQRLHEAILEAWNIRGVVLDYLQFESSSCPCAVVELLSAETPNAFRAVTLHDVMDLSEREIASLATLFREKSASSLLRLGWIYEAVNWVEQMTGDRIRSISELVQLNAGANFALLRFPMQSGRSYWLKATAHPNSHEQAITSYLSALCPGCVPDVLAVHPSWNAWIVPDECANDWKSIPDPERRLEFLSRAVDAIAIIQRRSVGHEMDLFCAGAFDQRLEALLADSTLLFEKVGEGMSLQTSTKVPRIEGAQLHDLRDTFDSVCEYLRTLSVPDTVLHGDMNAGNVLWGGETCQLIDWSEAYVGHPLVTLQHLLLLNGPEDSQLKSKWDRILIERYRAAMDGTIDSYAFERAIVCMPMMAAASALYGRGAWLRLPLAATLYRQSRIRTLARYMDRASRDLELQSLIRPRRVSIRRDDEVTTCC